MEIIIHVGHYAGWPAIAHALIQYEEVLKQDAAKAKNGKKGKKKQDSGPGRAGKERLP
jgi:hypothetical protein